jgi:hypothetical protein
MNPPATPAATAPPSPARAVVGAVKATTAMTGIAAIIANCFTEIPPYSTLFLNMRPGFQYNSYIRHPLKKYLLIA